MKKTTILILFSIAFMSGLWAQEVTQETIRKATCALFVEQVIGWEYWHQSSQRWACGYNETANTGYSSTKTPENTNNVRGVVLGIEDGKLVIFTLRSFLDPFYPCPAIQGFEGGHRYKDYSIIPLDNLQQDRERLIRYGRIQCTWVKDHGGGVIKVDKKIDGAFAADMDIPHPYGLPVPNHPQEIYCGITYSRPHEGISVDHHFYLQQLRRSSPVHIQYFDDHDVALIYINAPPGLQIDTLGLVNPTVVVETFLTRQRDLFGFTFNLVGQETMDKIRKYQPPQKPTFVMQAPQSDGWAMGGQILTMLKAVDTALDKALPVAKTIVGTLARIEYAKHIDLPTLILVGKTAIAIAAALP